MPVNKPLRADARRNRARILRVAEDVFAASGLSASVDEIARRVGVGVGTIYRHFPTKEALFEAILVNRMHQIIDTAHTLAEAEDAGQAFRDLFGYIVEQSMLSRALFEALSEATGVDLGAGSELGGRLRAAEQTLLERAQRAGAVRADITTDDLKALISGCLTMTQHTDNPARMVAIVCDGLRP